MLDAGLQRQRCRHRSAPPRLRARWLPARRGCRRRQNAARPAVASAPPSAPAIAASATTAASAASRRLPNMPELGSDSGFRTGVVAVPGAVAGRHDHDLAGQARRVGLGGFSLGHHLGRIGLGRFGLRRTPPWRVSALGAPARAPDSGDSNAGRTSTSASAPKPSPARSARPDEWGTAGPALREPDSPLVCSACCSLTFKSPVKVDHLVTFIACEIVTGRGLTEILGTRPGRFRRQADGAAAAANRPMLPCGNACGGPMRRLRRRISRLTWTRRTSQKAGGRHGHRKMHQRI